MSTFVPGRLIEIYASMQGEGPYVGIPMVFVRLQDCALSCSFCDTPASFEKLAQFRVETTPHSGQFSYFENPISSENLLALLKPFQGQTLSLTGGEPLQQADFLTQCLPLLHQDFKILLETNGVLPAALARVIEDVDIVSMDIKLPSVTGMRAYWQEHEEFLKIARQKELYVKVVVSDVTDLSELEKAIALVKTQTPQAPFILQPVTPMGVIQESISPKRLGELCKISRQALKDVRVIPQVHAMLGWY